MKSTATLVYDSANNKRLICLRFEYSPALVEKVKSLPQRKYHKEERMWTTPVLTLILSQLIKWGFELDEALLHIYQKRKNKAIETQQQLKNLPKQLYPFQKQGVAFLEFVEGRALLADEMGLGKTIQTICWCNLHPNKKPIIVVCPASLKLNWKKEINLWAPERKTTILSGTTPETIHTPDIVIINYDIVVYWVTELQKINPQILITDECHLYKNNSAKRTKAIKKLGKKTPHILALSGTPILNRPVEIYNAINLIQSDLFPNQMSFYHKYCGAKHNGFGWDFSGATNLKELHQILITSIMIRRKKCDVLKELPEKTRAFIPLELNNKKEYEKAQNEFIDYITEHYGQEKAIKMSNAETLTSINLLKQLAVKGKLEMAKQWIKDFLSTGEKLVIFAVHKFVIDELTRTFGTQMVKIDGSTKEMDRQVIVEKFQTDPKIKLFVGNIKAAGVGITLTASSNIGVLELPWTPGELTQAEDRCHRITQKNAVNVYYLIAENTIEEKIAHLIDKKRKILDAVLDGKESKSETLLIELIKLYNDGRINLRTEA